MNRQASRRAIKRVKDKSLFSSPVSVGVVNQVAKGITKLKAGLEDDDHQPPPPVSSPTGRRSAHEVNRLLSESLDGPDTDEATRESTKGGTRVHVLKQPPLKQGQEADPMVLLDDIVNTGHHVIILLTGTGLWPQCDVIITNFFQAQNKPGTLPPPPGSLTAHVAG